MKLAALASGLHGNSQSQDTKRELSERFQVPEEERIIEYTADSYISR